MNFIDIDDKDSDFMKSLKSIINGEINVDSNDTEIAQSIGKFCAEYILGPLAPTKDNKTIIYKPPWEQ